MFAVAQGDLNTLNILIEEGIDLNIPNSDGMTPLMKAASQVIIFSSYFLIFFVFLYFSLFSRTYFFYFFLYFLILTNTILCMRQRSFILTRSFMVYDHSSLGLYTLS